MYGVYSKHYYAGTQRIVSRLGDQDASIFDSDCKGCPQQLQKTAFDAKKLQDAQKANLQQQADQLEKGSIAFSDYKPVPLAEQEQTLLAERPEGGIKIEKYGYPVYYYTPTIWAPAQL